MVSSLLLLVDGYGQTTSLGLPQWLYVYPVVVGSLFMTLFGVANALNGPRRSVVLTLIGSAVAMALVVGWNALVPAHAIAHGLILALGFFGALFAGVPIGFVLAFSALLYFLSDPSLPILVYSQQVMAGSDHFVLLAIPFFVLAGLLMESNGMSSRLIELLLRIFGRVRGGMGLITITATAFFSGVSGSKLADIAAVGGIVMPAVRRTRQDPNEAAGLLACTAVMAETIPPCINLIIMGFVANISIAGLFMAGLVPAAVMALALAALAIVVGRKIDPDQAFEHRTPMLKLLGGALVALIMVAMIGKGVTSGIQVKDVARPMMKYIGGAVADAGCAGAGSRVFPLAAEPAWLVAENTFMTTIQDVARQAAVSVSTVSNVLNDRANRMRPDTLARVEAAILSLQFRPSKLAQQLKTGQTPLIGLLMPSITNPMYGYIAREIETEAQEKFGFRLLIGSTYRDREKESAFFEDLLSHGVRRVIVISSLADERHFESAVTG